MSLINWNSFINSGIFVLFLNSISPLSSPSLQKTYPSFNLLDYVNKHDYKENNKDCVFMYWDSLKYYKEFEEVQALEKSLSKFSVILACASSTFLKSFFVTAIITSL